MSEEFEEREGIKFPIVYVDREQDGRARFYCIYCRKFHYHGVGDGHRSAHCGGKSSPYLKTGYILKTLPGLGSKVQCESYIIHLIDWKDMSRQAIEISIETFGRLKDLNYLKLLDAYALKDYGETIYRAGLIFNLFHKDESVEVEDLQAKGNGTPDFMLVPEGRQYFYIEFKSESDALRLNQLISFNELVKNAPVYVLFIEKKPRIDNGRKR